MMAGGLSRRLVRVGQALVQHVTGGLGMVTVLSATFFAAISGSAPATTAAIGGIMIPEMEKGGWSRSFSTSLATASGPIGQIIPLSIPMFIWGVVAAESISQLFLAGIIPRLLIACGLMGWCWHIARREGIMVDTARATRAELVKDIARGKWSLAAPVVILGGIYGGVFTPTEAAAIGVAYALVIGLLVHREIKVGELAPLVLKSMRTAAMLCYIIAVASAFGRLIAIDRIPDEIAGGHPCPLLEPLRHPAAAQHLAAVHRCGDGQRRRDDHPGHHPDRTGRIDRTRPDPSRRDRCHQLGHRHGNATVRLLPVRRFGDLRHSDREARQDTLAPSHDHVRRPGSRHLCPLGDAGPAVAHQVSRSRSGSTDRTGRLHESIATSEWPAVSPSVLQADMGAYATRATSHPKTMTPDGSKR